MKAEKIFTPENRKKVRDAIAEAEAITSGEIRVFVDDRCKGSELDHAADVFEKLGMHKTEARNGVLIYISMEDHKFAVIGDKGIHEHVHDEFWQEVRDEMQEEFRKGEIIHGLVMGIRHAGKALSSWFPRSGDDKDELPNTIAFR